MPLAPPRNAARDQAITGAYAHGPNAGELAEGHGIGLARIQQIVRSHLPPP